MRQKKGRTLPAHVDLSCHFKLTCHKFVCLMAAEIGNFYYGPGHPMKPHRIRMCHNLLLNYRVYEKMDVFVCSLPLNRSFPIKKSISHFLHYMYVLDMFYFLFNPHPFSQRPQIASERDMTKFHAGCCSRRKTNCPSFIVTYCLVLLKTALILLMQMITFSSSR